MSKIVLITGVASGIGNACAEYFKTKGFTIVGLDRNPAVNKTLLDDFMRVNLVKPNQIDSFVRNFQCKYGQLDVLINNAGVHLFKSIQDTTLDEFDFVQSVNVRAPFLLCKMFHPMLKKTQGCIVNVSSVHAHSTTPNRTAYATSKAALLSLTRAVAVEFALDKIRVNAVLPGRVHTPMVREQVKNYETGGDEEKVDAWIKDLENKELLGKIGDPIDIAKTIYYFADSEQSGFATGQGIIVDGGSVAKYSLD